MRTERTEQQRKKKCLDQSHMICATRARCGLMIFTSQVTFHSPTPITQTEHGNETFNGTAGNPNGPNTMSKSRDAEKTRSGFRSGSKDDARHSKSSNEIKSARALLEWATGEMGYGAGEEGLPSREEMRL